MGDGLALFIIAVLGGLAFGVGKLGAVAFYLHRRTALAQVSRGVLCRALEGLFVDSEVRVALNEMALNKPQPVVVELEGSPE